jgi:hypothetical protein
MNFIKSLLVVCVVTCFFACKKTETLEFPKATEYYPTVVGKFIIYKLDSSNYIGYTSTPTITSYYIKDLIETQITDNLNRPSYRVARSIKKQLADAWQASNTFMITPLTNSIEYVENNLRYVRLQNPVKEDYSWKGNNYIEASGIYSNLQYLFDWEYQYGVVNEAKQYGTLSFPQTVTVKQADNTDGIVTDPNGYSERNYSVETFAKGVGLVYKEFNHWSYQPPSGNTPGYRSGYGVKLTIIDKN